MRNAKPQRHQETSPSAPWLAPELAQVGHTLLATADELRSPLSDLVRMQVTAAEPLVRAAVVLTAAYRPAESPAQQARRVALASALEMLHVALSVHGLLLASGREEVDLDRSVIGSTILAGDYCFSRAAQLAAQTDNPQVVEIFADALKEISELQLRDLFESQSEPGRDQASRLIRSGVLGAAHLNRLTTGETSAVLAATVGILNLLMVPATPHQVEQWLSQVPQFQRPAWEALIAWLAPLRPATTQTLC